MTDRKGPRLRWVPAFLAALADGKSVRKAAEAVGITSSTAYWLRNRNERFACEWQDACAAGKGAPKPGKSAPRSTHWRRAFLEALAETSNVTASADRVNVPTRTVYKLRREDADFAADGDARLAWFYERTPFYDDRYRLYPIGREVR